MSWLFFALTTAFFWGVAPVFGKLGLAKTDPLTALSIRTLGVVLVLLVINLFINKAAAFQNLTPKAWIFLLLEGICASLLGHFAYFYALKLGKASAVVPITAAFPLITVVIAAAIFHEYLSFGKIAGGLLVVAGIWLIKAF